MIGHHKRHPMHLKATWGARADGKLLAAQVEVIADAGPYAGTSTKVQGNATLTCTGPYDIPNVKVDTYTVFTNNVMTGAFRGFGGPQGEYEAEMQMNKLAEKLGMDPVELRLKNVLREGSILSVGTPIPKGISMAQVAEKCAVESGLVQGCQRQLAASRPRFDQRSDEALWPRLCHRVQERRLLVRRGREIGRADGTARRAPRSKKRSSIMRRRKSARARTPSCGRWPPKRSACRSRR